MEMASRNQPVKYWGAASTAGRAAWQGGWQPSSRSPTGTFSHSRPGFFLYQIPGMDDWKERFRCFHAGEIPYVFHFVNLPGLEEGDRVLSEQMAGYWARFAATGDPNGQGVQTWPRCATSDEQYLVLGNWLSPGRGYKDRLCDLIDEIEE